MKRIDTRLDGPILIEPRMIGDERGFFCETYRRGVFDELGIPEEMVQDNHSRSGEGIVRGMHFQIGAGRREARALRARRDRRRDGRHPPRLADVRRVGGVRARPRTTCASVYCPVGFAHGFCVLSDVADVMYKQSNYYADATERGIAYNDPDVAIEWPLPVEELIPSQRDASAPRLRDIEAELPFVYEGAVALNR